MYVVVCANLFGYAVNPTIQAIISNAVDPKRQGESMGAISSINSVAAVLAPLLGAPVLATVSHYPQGDWHIGMPFFLCAALQAIAAWVGIRYFARQHPLSAAAA